MDSLVGEKFCTLIDFSSARSYASNDYKFYKLRAPIIPFKFSKKSTRMEYFRICEILNDYVIHACKQTR